MTKEELKSEVDKFLETKPKEWRDGQAVFNYIDNAYNVAREVQFRLGVDCFYDDKQIDKFIEESAKIIDFYENC